MLVIHLRDLSLKACAFSSELDCHTLRVLLDAFTLLLLFLELSLKFAPSLVLGPLSSFYLCSEITDLLFVAISLLVEGTPELRTRGGFLDGLLLIDDFLLNGERS